MSGPKVDPHVPVVEHPYGIQSFGLRNYSDQPLKIAVQWVDRESGDWNVQAVTGGGDYWTNKVTIKTYDPDKEAEVEVTVDVKVLTTLLRAIGVLEGMV